MTKTYLNKLKPEEIIKRLKNGDIVKEDKSHNWYKMINGVLVKYFGDDFEISSGLYINEDNDYYFEDIEPFKIEKPGKYRTRDGQIAYVAGDDVRDDDDKYIYFGLLEDDTAIRYWSKSGESISSDSRDLVEYIGD